MANNVPITEASPSGQIKHLVVREQGNISAEFLNSSFDLGIHTFAINPDSGVLALYRTEQNITELVGEVGGGYTDQLVYTKSLGGLRFTDEVTGFEYFVNRRDVAGDTLGAVFGNLDTVSGNSFATSDTGGLTVCQKTNVVTSQDIGNHSSTNYIQSTSFSFQVTSDQVLPYGSQVLSFTGSTDIDFIDVPFDVRILNAAGTVVYSDIQSKAVFDADPSQSAFKLSSVAGVVTLPASQPFPMDSSETYTVEYTFATPIRLKGDGTQPALTVNGLRLEYYRMNYTAQTDVNTVDFTALSGFNYKIDTGGGDVVATVHETVKTLVVGDFDQTFGSPNDFTLSTEFGDIVFSTPEKGKKFEIIQHGSSFRVYNSDGSLYSVVS